MAHTAKQCHILNCLKCEFISNGFISVAMKQQIKEGIQYAIRTGIQESANFAYNYKMFDPVKQNVKEGIEFAAKTAGNEIKALLLDPQVKQDLKEALGSGGQKLR